MRSLKYTVLYLLLFRVYRPYLHREPSSCYICNYAMNCLNSLFLSNSVKTVNSHWTTYLYFFAFHKYWIFKQKNEKLLKLDNIFRIQSKRLNCYAHLIHYWLPYNLFKLFMFLKTWCCLLFINSIWLTMRVMDSVTLLHNILVNCLSSMPCELELIKHHFGNMCIYIPMLC